MTKNVKLSADALFSALVLGGSFAGSTVFAKDGATQSNGGTVTEVGHAYATFTRTSGGQVKTPSDPGISYTPGNSGDITNETGSLTLDAIPSSLNFGTQETTGVAQTVNLLPSTPGEDDDRAISGNGPATSDHGTDTAGKELNNQTIFTQVTNVSSNTIQWSLSATLGAFYKADKSEDVHTDAADIGEKESAIPGAFITLTDGAAVHAEIKTGDTKLSWQPADKLMENSLKLDAGTGKSTEIIASNPQKGVFQQQWKDANVTLTAPQGAPVGKYAADIAWTLSASPADQLDDVGTVQQDPEAKPEDSGE